MTRAEIHSTSDPAEADQVRMVLREFGVESFLENEQAALRAASSTLIPYVISVDEADAPRARSILKDARRAPIDESIPLQSFPCSCGKTLEVPAGAAGQSIDCPWCGASVTVP